MCLVPAKPLEEHAHPRWDVRAAPAPPRLPQRRRDNLLRFGLPHGVVLGCSAGVGGEDLSTTHSPVYQMGLVPRDDQCQDLWAMRSSCITKSSAAQVGWSLVLWMGLVLLGCIPATIGLALPVALSSCAGPALQERVVWPEVRDAWVEVKPMVAGGPADLVGSVGTAVDSRDATGLKSSWTLLAPHGETWVREQIEAGQLGPKGAEIARGLLTKFTLVVGRMR